MKIGILTFHRAHNYGAVLQAYALVTYLRGQGYQAEIIDYRPKSIENAHGTLPIGRLKNLSFVRKIIFLIKILPYLPARYRRAKKFHTFINSMPTSKDIYTDKFNSIKGYDYIIVGSDQVWNSHITNGLSPFYSGDIKSDAKWISYAASAEITPHQKEVEQYKNILKNFFKISVREKIFQEQLQPLTEKKVWQVLDPIFLLSEKQWLHIAKFPFPEDDYILVYQVKRHPRVLEYAKEWAKNTGCKVREITAEAEYATKDNRYMELSPEEFVGAFSQAKAVVTTSFHGTAFAVLFQKPVRTMMFNAPGDYRALDLLRTIGLNDSAITLDSEPTSSIIGCIPSNLANMIKLSNSFLKFE